MISVAPMMDWTDRHDRYFLRLISPNILLYTEMITAQALIHGDRDYLLRFDPKEHPIALQLGGSDPALLAESAKMGEEAGYDEINLNVGCPSPRVSKGRFGACLMLEPTLVAACVAAMCQSVKVPVTVKCRIGVDKTDSYEALTNFIKLIAENGCRTFIIHARKAWLQGLSPKENREIPPLNYDVVYQIKRDFPELKMIINGGIKTVDEIKKHLQQTDGVMIGREAYTNPYFLADVESIIYENKNILSRLEIIQKFLPYVEQQLNENKKLKLSAMTRHILGLFKGEVGAAMWRRYLSEHSHLSHADISVIEEAIKFV